MKLLLVALLFFVWGSLDVLAGGCGTAKRNYIEETCCRDEGFEVPNAGFAACAWKANKYQFTIKAVYLRKKDTGELVLLSATPKTFNAANADVGESMGAFIQNAQIPAGTYDAFVPHLHHTFTVDGKAEGVAGQDKLRVPIQGGGNVDVELPEFETNIPVVANMPACINGKLPAGNNDSDSCKLPDGTFHIFDTNMGTIEVKEGSQVEFNFQFNTQSAYRVEFNDGAVSGRGEYGPIVNITAAVS